MEEIRTYLLKHEMLNIYSDILMFLRNPSSVDLDELLKGVPNEVRNNFREVLSSANEVFCKDRAEYTQRFLLGQVVIWQEVLTAYERLIELSQRIRMSSTCPDMRHYETVEGELKKILENYAEMQSVLSLLENNLGVDRFLDRVGEQTFSVLEELLSQGKKYVEEKCYIHKKTFQEKWNTTNVCKLIGHKLVSPNRDNQICDLSLANGKQVILFVIDGFGYCQYLWHKDIDSQHESFTFKENIFNWLADAKCSSEYILGSSYVTDTAAGLGQIYLGQRSNETGIIASKVRKRRSGVNYLSTKTLAKPDFDSLFTCRNSITDIVSTYGYDTRLYYCSRYQTPPSGFSQHIFQSAQIDQVLPPERVFSMLLDDISGGMNSGLQIVYLTGIDNSGHTMGAYSAFEKFEHQKVGVLFKNFLIELAHNCPDLFDGSRSILVTADHGMYESSSKMVSRFEVLEALNESNIRNVKLVENNRAMLLYNEGTSRTQDIIDTLNIFFTSKKIDVIIEGENDAAFAACIGSPSSADTSPDAIIRIIGEGLFYSSNVQNSHLLHYGGHGGFSVDEVFVPLIEVPLNATLLSRINSRFLSRM